MKYFKCAVTRHAIKINLDIPVLIFKDIAVPFLVFLNHPLQCFVSYRWLEILNECVLATDFGKVPFSWILLALEPIHVN